MKNLSISSNPSILSWLISLTSGILLISILFAGHSIMTCLSFYKIQQYLLNELLNLKDPRVLIDDQKVNSIIDTSNRGFKSLISALHLTKRDEVTRLKMLISGPHFPRVEEKEKIEKLLTEITENDEKQNSLKQKIAAATIAQPVEPSTDVPSLEPSELEKLSQELEKYKFNRSNLKAQLIHVLQEILVYKSKPQVGHYTLDIYQYVKNTTSKWNLDFPDLGLKKPY